MIGRILIVAVGISFLFGIQFIIVYVLYVF
jgi:hypothetical protein